MEKPKIADTKPIPTDLKQNDSYFYCTCGQSANQPFCDGSHRGSSFKPLKFEAKESGKAYLCMCKQTKKAPYCDGTHKSVTMDSASTPSAVQSTSREEPTLAYIKELAKGIKHIGSHGEMDAMGVPFPSLPKWDDIQILAAQMARKPLLDNAEVGTELIIGPNAKKPLHLKIPLFVSDMSFGALSEEAKVSLAKGAELAGTGICSGEGGMLEEEQQANSRYFYELASAKFGFNWEALSHVQAFHFKGGQGAKTGTGGHLTGNKVIGKIAKVRNLKEGSAAISPATFTDLSSVEDFKNFANKVREKTGGIPIGFKLSANHIEQDMQFAIDASADYIILDGRGGGTGAAPLIFRNNISIPTIPALARARAFLKKIGREDITLIITGGLRVPEDFAKALALGADGVALSNSAIQAIGCVAARMCHTNNCPAGVATQKPELRAKLNVEKGAQQLAHFFESATHLMQVLARACGHKHLSLFNQTDLTTWKKEMADLSGVAFAGKRSKKKVKKSKKDKKRKKT